MKQHWYNLTQCLSSLSSTSDKYSLFIFNNNIIFSIAITNKKTIYNKELSNTQRGFISILVKVFLEIFIWKYVWCRRHLNFYSLHHGVFSLYMFIECIIRLLNIFTLNRFLTQPCKTRDIFRASKETFIATRERVWSGVRLKESTQRQQLLCQ